MVRMWRWVSYAAAVVVLTAGTSQGLSNGSFERNGGIGTSVFTDWTETDTGDGSWLVQSGTHAPFSSMTVPAPPDGKFAAMTSQDEQSAQVLYQDFVVPPRPATLRCDVFISNQASDFVAADSGSLTANVNQLARIDILDTSAGPYDTGSAVLQNLFITNPGDPGQYTSYKTIEAALDAFAGQTVRLRFGVIVTQDVLYAGVDNCSIITPSLAPALGASETVGLCIALLALGCVRLHRLRVQRSRAALR